MSAIDIIPESLLKVIPEVWHYEAYQQIDRYIVWAEDGAGKTSWADNICTYQTIQGTIHYFTKTESDPNFKKIQDVLNQSGIVWRFNSVQYERETKYIHYEWVWEVVNGDESDN